MAVDLARQCDSTVTLLHVIETVENVPFEELKDFYEQLEAKAESVLRSLEGNFQKCKIETQRAIVFGNRLEQIIKFAGTDKTDLIVLASHMPDENLEKPRWGSLSHRVAILAPCSVMLHRCA